MTFEEYYSKHFGWHDGSKETDVFEMEDRDFQDALRGAWEAATEEASALGHRDGYKVGYDDGYRDGNWNEND